MHVSHSLTRQDTTQYVKPRCEPFIRQISHVELLQHLAGLLTVEYGLKVRRAVPPGMSEHEVHSPRVLFHVVCDVVHLPMHDGVAAVPGVVQGDLLACEGSLPP